MFYPNYGTVEHCHSDVACISTYFPPDTRFALPPGPIHITFDTSSSSSTSYPTSSSVLESASSTTATPSLPIADSTTENTPGPSSQSQYQHSSSGTPTAISSSTPISLSKSASFSISPLSSKEHFSPSLVPSESNFDSPDSPPHSTVLVVTSTSSESSHTSMPQETQTQPTPEQALSLRHSSRAGPIAGGLIGGLLLVAALLLLWLYRKRILNRWSGRHRVAPSSEFLNAGIRALTPRDGMLGAERQQRVMSLHEDSRTVLTGPYGATQHIRRSSSAPPSNPLPSPPGFFADRLGNSQWLNDASRRREELYQAAATSGSTDSQQDLVASAYPKSPPPLMVHYTPPASYPSSPRDVSSHARQESGTTVQASHEGSGRRNSDPFQDQSDSEEDMQTTSPMMSPSKVTQVDGQADAATGTNVTLAEQIGWAV